MAAKAAPDGREDVVLPLDEQGRPTGVFHWRMVEPAGRTWSVSGTYQLGERGLQITELEIVPSTPEGQSQGITFSTLKELKLSYLRQAISAKLSTYRQFAGRQLAALKRLPPRDDPWDAADQAQYVQAWEEFEVEVSRAAKAAGRHRATGGRRPNDQSEWARRAEKSLDLIHDGKGNLYPRLAEALSLGEEAIRKNLQRMRRPVDEKDLGSGWLAGTRASTVPGPRLLAWRAHQAVTYD